MALFCTISPFLLAIPEAQPVIASGDTGPAASEPVIGDRSIMMSILVNHAVLKEVTNSSAEDNYVTIRLQMYDNKTGENIREAFYSIKLMMAENNMQQIINDTFYAPNGTLNFIMFKSENATATIIHGNQDAFSGAWIGNSSGWIAIETPSFNKGGSYGMHIAVLGIDQPRLRFEVGKAPQFDFIWDKDDMTKSVRIVPEFSVANVIMVSSFVVSLSLISALSARKNLR